jgi:hypothetical protein
MATQSKQPDGDEPDRKPLPENLQNPQKQGFWLLRQAWDMMNTRDEHFVFALVGREGSGKSHTALRFGEELDPTFSADRVMYDVVDLLDILQNGDHSRGDVYVLDEAGVSMGNRTWQERSQILANQALQLIRSHNIGLIFTLPALSDLDKQAEERLHGFMEIDHKREGEFVRGTWLWVDVNRRSREGEKYHHLPIRSLPDGPDQKVRSVAFGPPTKSLVQAYEPLKAEHQEEMYEETMAELDGEEAEEEKELSATEIAERIMADGGAEQYCREVNNGAQVVLDKELIAADWDVGNGTAKRVKSVLMREVDKDVL